MLLLWPSRLLFRDKQNSTNETNGVWTSSTFPQAASGEEGKFGRRSLDTRQLLNSTLLLLVFINFRFYLFALFVCFFRNGTGFFSLSFSLFSHSVFIGPINIIIFFSQKVADIENQNDGTEWSFLPNVIHELMLIFEIMLIFLKKNKMRVQVSHLFLFLFFFLKLHHHSFMSPAFCPPVMNGSD